MFFKDAVCWLIISLLVNFFYFLCFSIGSALFLYWFCNISVWKTAVKIDQCIQQLQKSLEMKAQNKKNSRMFR